MQVEAQESFQDELDTIQDRHSRDSLLQLQLAADKLAIVLSGAHYDHQSAMKAAEMSEQAAARPWADASGPFRDTLLQCAAPPLFHQCGAFVTQGCSGRRQVAGAAAFGRVSSWYLLLPSGCEAVATWSPRLSVKALVRHASHVCACRVPLSYSACRRVTHSI